MTPLLDLLAVKVSAAQDGAARTFAHAQRFSIATTEEARQELAQLAGESARACFDATGDALNLLRGAGARLPERGAKKPQPNPLAELVKQERSRSEAEALLEALRAALPQAEALDLARGDVLPEPVNGLRGLVWGEELCQMVARLELELYGPKKIAGGRE